jgi:hypothetical protein
MARPSSRPSIRSTPNRYTECWRPEVSDGPAFPDGVARTRLSCRINTAYLNQ